MWYYWLLFYFIAFISKALLAFVMIYLLLPDDGLCGECEEPTLLIRPNRFGRIAFALSLGKIQWRWCPRCGRESLARHTKPASRPRSPARQDESIRTRK
jgi:hypothetical protein